MALQVQNIDGWMAVLLRDLVGTSAELQEPFILCLDHLARKPARLCDLVESMADLVRRRVSDQCLHRLIERGASGPTVRHTDEPIVVLLREDLLGRHAGCRATRADRDTRGAATTCAS